MEGMHIVESVLRWVHVVAGVLWIGLLYFFNFVNASFAATMDADTKKKVVPELMPRTLYFFRWGAAWTWVTGVLLLAIVYYHDKYMYESGKGFDAMTAVVLAVTFLGVLLYDALMKQIKQPQGQFWIGFVLASAVAVFFLKSGASYRGAAIHLGALFGTNMAFNVWMRIWPAQQKIIAAVKSGQAPDGALVALAGGRSKHNTYMSVPLIFLMLTQHMTWAASKIWALPATILVGWLAVYVLYAKAKQLKGF